MVKEDYSILLFKAFETELNRLLEVERKGDLENASEILVYFADKHRQKLGLEGFAFRFE